jgi:hypothetical protein
MPSFFKRSYSLNYFLALLLVLTSFIRKLSFNPFVKINEPALV